MQQALQGPYVETCTFRIGFLEESLSRLAAVLVSVTSKQNQRIQQASAEWLPTCG